MPGRDCIEYLKVLADSNSKARVVIAGNKNDRTLSTASQLGDVLGLERATTLPKPVSIHLLRRELFKFKQASRPITIDCLARAINEEQIRPHFQPKVTRDNRGLWVVSEVEALARWYRGDDDIVMPDSFVGLAEECGLIRPLTESILRQVVMQLRAWDETGQNFRAAVNLSPVLLTDSSFPDQLDKLMKEHQIANNRLILEVTEQVVMEYTATTTEVLSRLRAKNFNLALDDFGTGHSSLEQLYRMPFDELKIDRSIVAKCHADKDMRIIIEAIVLLGHKLGLSVCADGVETQSAFDFLARIGCDKLQGFLVGRPENAARVETSLRNQTASRPKIRAIL
jgi:EAL domain-containing protein (putative c-di-GMP-specific phosphodiesterase class I)